MDTTNAISAKNVNCYVYFDCSWEAGDLDIEGGKCIRFDGLQLPGLYHAVRQRVDPLQEQGAEKRGSSGNGSAVPEAKIT